MIARVPLAELLAVQVDSYTQGTARPPSPAPRRSLCLEDRCGNRAVATRSVDNPQWYRLAIRTAAGGSSVLRRVHALLVRDLFEAGCRIVSRATEAGAREWL